MARRSCQWLAATIAVSVGLRLGAAVYLGDRAVDMPGTADQVSYHALALRVLEGHGFTFGEGWWPLTAANAPTAHWSYLYTLYLVAVYALFGPHPLAARLIQAAIVGVLHPYLAYRIGARAMGERAGLIASGLTAVYAYFIYYSATLMTEPFYFVALMASLHLAMRIAAAWRAEGEHPASRGARGLAVAWGLVLAAAVLLRQLILFVIPFLYLWLGSIGRRKALAVIGVATGVLGVLILPFTLSNYSRFGRIVLLNTNSGFAFFWANHPIYGTRFESILPSEMGTYGDLIPTELRHLDEAALDQALLQRGIQFVLDEPGRYLLLSLSRIPAYFKFWPSSESGPASNVARVLSFGVLWPFMLYGLARCIVERAHPLLEWIRSPTSLLVLFVAVYSAIHLLSWALIRYRLPVDSLLILFAGFGFADLASRLAAWRRRRVAVPT